MLPPQKNDFIRCFQTAIISANLSTTTPLEHSFAMVRVRTLAPVVTALSVPTSAAYVGHFNVRSQAETFALSAGCTVSWELEAQVHRYLKDYREVCLRT